MIMCNYLVIMALLLFALSFVITLACIINYVIITDCKGYGKWLVSMLPGSTRVTFPLPATSGNVVTYSELRELPGAMSVGIRDITQVRCEMCQSGIETDYFYKHICKAFRNVFKSYYLCQLKSIDNVMQIQSLVCQNTMTQ